MHVGAHKRALVVVVLEERNERGSYGNKLFRRNVHVIDAFLFDFLDSVDRFLPAFLIFVGDEAAVYAVVNEMAFFVQRFVCLRDDVSVLDVCRQIVDVIGYDAGGFIYLSIRGLYKSIFIYACVSGKGRDKTDVLTFRGFDRAHSAVVSVVNVTNFEACSFAAETPGPKAESLRLCVSSAIGLG